MTYNGIGVRTPRGTGTSGYVQTSLVSLRPPPMIVEKKQKAVRKQSKSIEEYTKRHKIELNCVRYRKELEKKNLSEDEIKEKVKLYHLKLTDPKAFELKMKEETSKPTQNEVVIEIMTITKTDNQENVAITITKAAIESSDHSPKE